MEGALPIKLRPIITILLLALLIISGCASKPKVPQPSISDKKSPLLEPDFPKLIAKVEQDHGPVAANRIRYWAKLVKQGKHLSATTQLNQTNRFFNDARFVTDQEIWQREDYWATPTEFLIKDAGDCEDFAIAKYFTLRFMGVDDDKMRLSYVKALTLDKPHMVLSYYTTPNSTPLVLDNIEPRILPADLRQDLVPVYSFNGDSLWLAKSRGRKLAGKAGTLPQWRGLTERIEEETR